MLLAMAAFVQLGALSVAAQAASAAGFMPVPADTIAGPVHAHGKGAGHVHTHSGNNAAGHTHHHDYDDDMDEPANTLFFAVGTMSAVVAQAAGLAVAFDVVTAKPVFRAEHRLGVEPGGLDRPPSTPGIG